MPSYAAFIGHQPHISLAELSATIPDFRVQKILHSSVILFETSLELDRGYFGTLGGTIAIGRRFDDTHLTKDALPPLLAKEVSGVKGKIVFSLRTHGLSPRDVKDLYKHSKDLLKKKGRAVRYVGSPDKAAPSIVLHEEGLLDGKHGCELVVIADKDVLWVGKTMDAQDIEAYAKRDMKKPVRDTGVGLLPPKLAQILLNFGAWLAREKMPAADGGKKMRPLVILDPFCGTGVVPMECLLREWPVLASDASLKAVNGCTKNLEWLRKEVKIPKKDVSSMVAKHDARKPFDLAAGKPFKWKEPVDAIVTETSLGPALTDRPNVKDIGKIRTEMEALQIDFLKNMAACFPGVPVICTWPAWYGRKDRAMLEKVWSKLGDIGYDAVLPPGILADVEGRTSLVYRRPDQFVAREIIMLRPRTRISE